MLSARKAAGLTQRQLAERLKTSPSVISQYENGRVEPTVWALARIVEACGSKLRIYLDQSDPNQGDPGLAERRARAKEIMGLRARAHLEADVMWGEPTIMPGFQKAALEAHHKYVSSRNKHPA